MIYPAEGSGGASAWGSNMNIEWSNPNNFFWKKTCLCCIWLDKEEEAVEKLPGIYSELKSTLTSITTS